MIDLPWYTISKWHRGYEQWLPVDDDMPELEEVDYDDMPALTEPDDNMIDLPWYIIGKRHRGYEQWLPVDDDMPALTEPDDNQ
jgi:hypothetical protein